MAHVYFDASGVAGLGEWVIKASLIATRIRQLGVRQDWSWPRPFFISETYSGRSRPEDNFSGNDKLDLRSGSGRTHESELSADACRSLAHSLQPEMSLPSPADHSLVNADPIISDAQSNVLSVSELHINMVSAGVRAGVANRLIADSVDLISHNRMHVPGVAND